MKKRGWWRSRCFDGSRIEDTWAWVSFEDIRCILYKEAGTGSNKETVVRIGGGGGSAPIRCLAMLTETVCGVGVFEVDHVTSISGINPTSTLGEHLAVGNPLAMQGSVGSACIVSRCAEANAVLAVDAGDFIFDIIACSVSP